MSNPYFAAVRRGMAARGFPEAEIRALEQAIANGTAASETADDTAADVATLQTDVTTVQADVLSAREVADLAFYIGPPKSPGGGGGGTGLTAIADLRVLANTSGGPAVPIATAFSALVGVGSALKWTTARALSFTGDVTGSGNVDGSAAVATALTIANSAVTLAKIANAAAVSKWLGSGASGSGAAYTENAFGKGLVVSATTLNALPRVSSAASVASPLAWNSDTFDQYAYTALANALTINADAGTPADGQKAIFRIKDDGTARALTWTTGSSGAFRAVGVTLPTTTVLGKTVYVGCIYNANAARWDAVATAQEI